MVEPKWVNSIKKYNRGGYKPKWVNPEKMIKIKWVYSEGIKDTSWIIPFVLIVIDSELTHLVSEASICISIFKHNTKQ